MKSAGTGGAATRFSRDVHERAERSLLRVGVGTARRSHRPRARREGGRPVLHQALRRSRGGRHQGRASDGRRSVPSARPLSRGRARSRAQRDLPLSQHQQAFASPRSRDAGRTPGVRRVGGPGRRPRRGPGSRRAGCLGAGACHPVPQQPEARGHVDHALRADGTLLPAPELPPQPLPLGGTRLSVRVPRRRAVSRAVPGRGLPGRVRRRPDGGAGSFGCRARVARPAGAASTSTSRSRKP